MIKSQPPQPPQPTQPQQPPQPPQPLQPPQSPQPPLQLHLKHQVCLNAFRLMRRQGLFPFMSGLPQVKGKSNFQMGLERRVLEFFLRPMPSGQNDRHSQ